MKRKSIILLASAVLGMGLVGGTLAGWAVTDNADPLGIGISPGTVTIDKDTTYITLKWGGTQNIDDVSNLKKTETRIAGILDLAADTTSTKAVTGNFRMKLGGDATLLGYMNVDVYQGAVSVYSNSETYAVDDLVLYNAKVYACTTAVTVAEDFAPVKWSEQAKLAFEAGVDGDGYQHKNIPIRRNVANPYTVITYLSEINQTVYDTLREGGKQVTVTFDWGIGTTEVIATRDTIFFKGINNPYVYAFKGEDKMNAAWPGVKMTAAKAPGYYTYELDSNEYDYVVFNDGQASGGLQTRDISIATEILATDKNCLEFVHGETDTYTFNFHDESVAVKYFLKGNNISVSDTPVDWETGYELVGYTGAASTIVTVETTGNAELKFFELSTSTWYGADAGANFTLGEAGTYKLTFDPSSGTPISAEKL